MPRNRRPIHPEPTVEAWLAPPSAQGLFDAAVLDGEQRARWLGLRSPRRRRDFEVSRALWQAVAPPADLAWSLSHSHGHAALAVSAHGPVGIDVEVCTQRDVVALAAAAFTADEAAFVAGRADEVAATQAFYELWVLKEACAKALAVSLTQVLQGTNFAAAIRGEVIGLGERLRATGWGAWVYAPAAELRLAVFAAGHVNGAACEPSLHTWPPAERARWPLVHRLGHCVAGARVARA
jgi:Phosphopantetheinyl transferase